MGKGQCEAAIEVGNGDTVYCVRSASHAGPHSADESCREEVRRAKKMGAQWRPARPSRKAGSEP